MGNSEWLDASRYTDPSNIREGVLGKLHGVEFAESNNGLVTLSAGYSTSASNIANVYSNFFFGAHAYAMVILGSNAEPKVFVKTPSANSTDNPINMFSTIGWKMPFVAKTLNSNWLINLKTGATDGFNAS